MPPELANITSYRSALNAGFHLALPWSELSRKRVLITGATGMIGSVLTDMFMARGDVFVTLMGRSEEKARTRFASYFGVERFSFIRQDVTSPLGGGLAFDYIIHAAGNAHPTAYSADPVGTMNGAYLGALNLLEHGLRHDLKRFLMISSGEVYGQPQENLDSFSETYSGYVDTMQPRSCYPCAKRAAETLCASYKAQYGLDVVVARPCHVYGPSQTAEDSRAVSQFFRAAAAGRDIVLKSKGAQVRSYCHVIDVASALATILLSGESGEAYNIADRHSVVSIADLAHLIAATAGVKVLFEENPAAGYAGYTPITRGVLNSEKLEALGWSAGIGLKDGIAQTLEILRAPDDR